MHSETGHDPLELKFEVLWPNALLGANGKWRNDGPNYYNANDDAAAVRAWLEKQQKRLTKDSLDSYTSDIEKLVFWAIAIRLKPLSSLEHDDLIMFKSFLHNPPSNWVESCPFLRAAPQWRPFRKALSSASVLPLMTVVLKLYADWYAAGYLKLDPMLGHRAALQGPKPDPKDNYWLTRRHWVIIHQQLEQRPPSPMQRLLRASILFLQRAGVSCKEAVELFYGDLTFSGENWTATLPERRGRTTTVVVLDEVVIQALLEHNKDRQAYEDEGRMARFSDVPEEHVPLLSVFETGTMRETEPAVPQRPSEKLTLPKLTGDQRAKCIRDLIMDFMQELSNLPELVAKKEEFIAIAAHWLRDPARQTETIRRQVLIKKQLGLTCREVVDEPDVERKELFAILEARAWPFPNATDPQ
jgi:hypothetical protein